MTIRFFLIYTFLFATSLTKAEAQNPLQEADRLFNNQQYLEASIAYEKVIFSQPKAVTVRDARYKKALCYRNMERYTDALNELNRINLFNAPMQLQTKVFYEKAFNLFLQDNYKEALWNFKRIREEKISQSKRQSIQPLKILILNGNRRWEKSKETFHHWINKLNYTKHQKEQWTDSVNSLYGEKNTPKNYSAEKARNLSRFIPGAGHTYTGHFWEGLESFLFNAAMLGAGIHQIWTGYYFTAYIAGLGIFYKFYFGGMERSAHLAKIERENEMALFNEQTSKLVQKILVNEQNNKVP